MPSCLRSHSGNPFVPFAFFPPSLSLRLSSPPLNPRTPVFPFLRALRSDSRFKSYEKECMRQADCAGVTLQGLLIQPVQRVLRYSLLLKEVLKTLDAEAPAYAALTAAAQSIGRLNDGINDTVGRQKEAAKVLRLQQELGVLLLAPGRQLRREGRLKILKRAKGGTTITPCRTMLFR